MTSKPGTQQKLTHATLAKALGKNREEIEQLFAATGLIVSHGDTWVLTPQEESKGGQYREGRFGRFIVWPNDFKPKLIPSPPPESLLTATAVGKHFDSTPARANSILSELGWMDKHIKGWLVTDIGRGVGGF